MLRKLFFAAVVLALGAASPAKAAVMTWYLDDVVFDDGGTAFGSYDFDAATVMFSSINVTTTNPDGSIANIYNETPFDLPASFYPVFSQPDFPNEFDPILIFTLTAAMTASGGTIPLAPDFSFEGLCAAILTNPCGNVTPLRYVASGSVTTTPLSAVPLPAGGLLLLSGLAGLAGLRFRQKRKAQV